MGILQNKIDFVAFVAVTMANPNGDPLNGNSPRTDYDGLGEMSDVCIKRKLRNRMLVLITYDVNTEDAAGRKRLRQIAKQCVNYG